MSDGRERTILHVDMDAFFVSVERLSDPALRNVPVVVGGAGPRGVVASASYEARAYGVYSAMPSVRARRLCPHAVFVAGHYRRYHEVSDRVMAILGSITPLVEPLSLDEAFCDVTGVLHGRRSGRDVAHEVRGRIRRELGLECGVGVATTKFVAKVASKHAKPPVPAPGGEILPGTGIVVVPGDQTRSFLTPLPVRELWGVGPVTGRHLADLGVYTIGDLARLPVATLRSRLGKANGERLHDLSRGVDPRPVVPDGAVKSVGHEETFAQDVTGRPEMRRILARLADATARRLIEKGLTGRTVSIKVRSAGFETITRSRTLAAPTDRSRIIGATAQELFDVLDLSEGVRLLGVSVSGLVEPGGGIQLRFTGFDEDQAPGAWVDAELTVDAIRARFGHDAIAPASLMEGSTVRVRRRGDRQWGPPAETSDDDGPRPR